MDKFFKCNNWIYISEKLPFATRAHTGIWLNLLLNESMLLTRIANENVKKKKGYETHNLNPFTNFNSVIQKYSLWLW